MAMDDVILTVFKIMDCPLLPWDVWKTTLADCKRCRCVQNDVMSSVQNDQTPYVVCDIGKGVDRHLAIK